MERRTFTKIREFCFNYGVDESFVFDLQKYEVIEITLVGNEAQIPEDELPILEKMVRLHHDLEINPEGLQAIHHLLEKVNTLQEEITLLHRKLRRFED